MFCHLLSLSPMFLSAQECLALPNQSLLLLQCSTPSGILQWFFMHVMHSNLIWVCAILYYHMYSRDTPSQLPRFSFTLLYVGNNVIMMTMMGRDGNTVSVGGGGGEALSGTGLNLYKIQRIHRWPLFFLSMLHSKA